MQVPKHDACDELRQFPGRPACLAVLAGAGSSKTAGIGLVDGTTVSFAGADA